MNGSRCRPCICNGLQEDVGVRMDSREFSVLEIGNGIGRLMAEELPGVSWISASGDQQGSSVSPPNLIQVRAHQIALVKMYEVHPGCSARRTSTPLKRIRVQEKQDINCKNFMAIVLGCKRCKPAADEQAAVRVSRTGQHRYNHNTTRIEQMMSLCTPIFLPAARSRRLPRA